MALGPDYNSPEWKFDPDLTRASEVEIRFTAEPAGTTLVELVHSRLERHGGDTVNLREKFEEPGHGLQSSPASPRRSTSNFGGIVGPGFRHRDLGLKVAPSRQEAGL